MKVSINICTFNRALHLEKTLNAFRSVQVPDGMSAEVLVVDNGSTDETAALVRSAQELPFKVSYFSEPRRGKGYAYNRALAESRGEVIVFVDDDVRPGTEWLGKLCVPIHSKVADAVAGWIRIPNHLRRSWMTSWHQSLLASTEDWNPIQIAAMNGANMAFSRRVLEKVPAFDTELGPGALGFWDEALFSRQVVKAGYRLIGAPDAWVEHHFDETRLSRAAFLDRAWKEGRSRGYVAWHWEHEEIPRAWLMVWRKRLRLLLARARRRSERGSSEGCPEWEISLTQKIAYYRQYAIESRRLRAYEKYGLCRKKSANGIRKGGGIEVASSFFDRILIS